MLNQERAKWEEILTSNCRERILIVGEPCWCQSNHSNDEVVASGTLTLQNSDWRKKIAIYGRVRELTNLRTTIQR